MAAKHDLAEMARIIGVDSLAFISLDGLYRALGRDARDPAAPAFCDACFTGEYAIPLTDWQANSDRQLSLLQPAGQ
jgi:amidophosphoribosyltransferase